MLFIKLSDQNFYSKIPAMPGIYKIIALDKHDKFKTISRVCGFDQKGILYIGSSKNLKLRLNGFKSCVIGKKYRTHSAGIKYIERKKLIIKYPAKNFKIFFKITNNYKKEERDLINKYVNIYGETPTLNSH